MDTGNWMCRALRFPNPLACLSCPLSDLSPHSPAADQSADGKWWWVKACIVAGLRYAHFSEFGLVIQSILVWLVQWEFMQAIAERGSP